jgi:ATP-binding cassette subfamily C (CFTR/MRP) protein 4
MFAAIISIFLLIPVQSHFARKFKYLRTNSVFFRDERIKTLSDMISGIMVVKLYAWESPFIEKIRQLRNKELKYIWKGNMIKGTNLAIYSCSSIIINAITFSTFWFTGGQLTAARVFSVITYLQVLKLSITIFIPAVTQLLSECFVSVKRIQEFLLLDDLQVSVDQVEQVIANNEMIRFENTSFEWNKGSGSIILKDLQFTINKGELVAVCGSVGSGKSSLLNTIIGDMHLVSGKKSVKDCKVGYVSQTPWLISGTIKDIILFGQPLDEERLKKVIQCCSLNRDLTLFPNGLDTFVGERGVTLSGIIRLI